MCGNSEISRRWTVLTASVVCSDAMHGSRVVQLHTNEVAISSPASPSLRRGGSVARPLVGIAAHRHHYNSAEADVRLRPPERRFGLATRPLQSLWRSVIDDVVSPARRDWPYGPVRL